MYEPTGKQRPSLISSIICDFWVPRCEFCGTIVEANFTLKKTEIE
jgi:hypothetical protein